MDPVTHFLTGACMGRSGFHRKTAYATVTMVLAAESADIDVVWGFKGSIEALQHHRGITHSFVGVPFLAATVLGLVYLWHRFRLRRGKLPSKWKLPVRWGLLYFCALLAALSHLLLDYTTAYGIRLFEPFDYRWYSWDIVSIIEPLLLLAMLAALLLPGLFSLVSHEIGERRQLPRGGAAAIAALTFMVLLWGFRDYEHRRALAAMDSFLYRGAEPQRVAAYPYMINPFSWHGVVETRDFFESVPVDSRKAQVDNEQGIAYFKPPVTDVLQAAKRSYFGQVYLDWAVFPFARQEKVVGESEAFLVDFVDIRYAYPSQRGSTLGGFVLVSPELRVLAQGMSRAKPAALEQLNHALETERTPKSP